MPPAPAFPFRCLPALALIVGLIVPLLSLSAHTTGALRVEYQTNPVGIDVTQPRLSWKLAGPRRGLRQTAYQIQVANSAEKLAAGDCVWDSGRVESDQSVFVDSRAPAPRSGSRYHWRVRTWDEDGAASAWSEVGFWETGLLQSADWTARWITPGWVEDPAKPKPAAMLRKEFRLRDGIREARLYISSLGLYEAELNGSRVGDAVLTPGWTSYDKRLQYQTYDVTAELHPGANAIGVTLGDGWYRGPLVAPDQRNHFGERLALIAQLRVTYSDGATETIASDASWKAATGPILFSEIYAGERYDALREADGWSRPGYDDHAWSAVQPVEHAKEILVAPQSPPVRRIEEIAPRAVRRTGSGRFVVDFGQNMVGHVRLKVRGPAGTTITLRHAEVLEPTGELYRTALRGAAQQVEYTLRGGGEEIYEPHFTFQGFRYVSIDGWPGELATDSLTGVVVHSDLPVTGHWESSNPLLNQLQHNIVWGQKGNFVDVPTDCPQRDERLGWTGDAQIFGRTAAFNRDVAGFFAKWLGDVAADQKPSGTVPYVIPDVLSRHKENDGSSGWGDVATILPWTLYLVYGDRGVLAAQYPSMKAWVEYIRARAQDDLWKSGWHFGDWLSYATTSPDYPGATTGKDLIATAFYAHSTALLAQAATVLGHTDDAREYAALAERIKSAFNREFVTPAGRVGEATQTAYALALEFDLLPEAQRAEAARRLAENVRSFGHHLTTGFLGTPYLCHVLSEHGHLDTAYALLLQETYPSWLYPVKQGATTIWERWDGIKPDGTFQDPSMNSFNHYAYGAVGDWMYRTITGLELDPAEPGYRHAVIRPRPGGGLTSAQARLDTPYGELASAWSRDGDRFELNVTVPANTHASIHLPDSAVATITESGKKLEEAEGVTGVARVGPTVVVQTGAGTYQFAYTLSPKSPPSAEH